ncbi:proteasome regulatory particle base subunit RPN2 [Sugiyamaella lignohabitans]|uniref:26S proteasome regulatory subunit RPN2 n=1 Tax=Sugiyamaella lignohabitans TaxID=796027 RepID=A0A167FVY7_9ASCO|nr:proteasome regulatory particle base subunit RPN2 [Sugiyamaella lignohabitans]ANB15768.1 proteasome regulatory particle base subunit RPN2 [Sugiyamaella lignohabitans]
MTSEELYEDDKFPAPQLAALVASKVYYNLGEFNASMRFALVAGDKLDLSQQSEYVETIISKCLSHYISVSQKLHDIPKENLTDEEKVIDPKLVAVAEKMLKRCIDNGDHKLALGVVLEARRLDIIESILKNAGNAVDATGDETTTSALAQYVLDCSISLVSNREFRNKVLHMLVGIILDTENADYFAISKIIVQLNDSNLALRLFKDLLSNAKLDDTKRLIAYQVAFDLVASAPQQLLESVANDLTTFNGADKQEGGANYYDKLIKILSGVPTCDLNITFLQKHNNTDLSILNKTKNQLDGRNSIFHSAVTFENAFMHAGTTADGFFRSNLEWLSKATNWTKFSATAALGVIHQGNLSQGRRILQPYLPGSQGSCYSQGGSLFALGLIFAGHGREVVDYLRQHITDGGVGSSQNSEAEVVLHGAALGVGVAGMASGNVEVYEELRNILFSDSAIAGEGVGLAMGLVMAGGSGSSDASLSRDAADSAQAEMLQYAHDTQHEKIIRSLAIGIAVLNYAKEEAADVVIQQLISEQDPILRYGGAFTIALAYAGTGNNKAIKLLLHIAVSDASDDVRRAAVMGLGFILLRNHTAVPRMVELLSESHNPHVRYGTAMALGISCAGTGLKQAIDVLEPMMKDPVDFVRQGSMIALAMILIQQNEKLSPKVKQIQQAFAKVISAKHEDAMAKFGAALAQGIIDAGGRNVTISLEHQQTGNLNMKAVVGLAVFVQFWNWFPLAHFLSLAFTPTAIVGVREDRKVPKFNFNCHVNPKLFGYPAKVEEQNEKAPEKVVTAILSTTIKAKHRARKTNEAKKKMKQEVGGDSGDESDGEKDVKKDSEQEDESKMDVDATSAGINAGKEDLTLSNTTIDDGNNDSAIVNDEFDQFCDSIQKSSRRVYKVENMSRVLPSQLKYISFDKEGRFVPIRKFRGVGGVIVVTDNAPKEPVEIIKTVRQINSPDDDEDDEAPLPEPFEYIPEENEE